MQPYTKKTLSVYHLGGATSRCEHFFLQQITYPSLPPLYIKSKLHGPTTSRLPFQAVSYIQESLQFLGSMKLCSSVIGRDVNALRQELEEVMSKDRREQMRLFVRWLKEKRQRRAAEVYLSRYPGFGFVLDGEGTLDYGIGDRFIVEENK